MPHADPDDAANVAGWVVAAIVAVVAICAITFMITMRPATAPAVAAYEPMRGAQSAASFDTDIARARADQAARLAEQSADKAHTAAQNAAHAAAQEAARAISPLTASDAAADASASEPVAPAGPAPLQTPGQ